MSCSSDRVNYLYSNNKNLTEIGGGTREEYNPQTLKVELEDQVNNNFSLFKSGFVSSDGTDQEVGITGGLKLRTDTQISPYIKTELGMGYLTKDFDKQDTHMNFYLGGGLGLEFQVTEDCGFLAGMRYGHFSNGKKYNRFVGRDTSNNGINQKGGEFGISCKL
jgi:hypothetical protein